MFLFLQGLFVQEHHVFLHSSIGYLTGVTYPLYPIGIGLIVVFDLFFTIRFFFII